MTTTINLGSNIILVKNAIPEKTCELLVGECKKYYDKLFERGPTISGIQTEVKDCFDFNFSAKDAIFKKVPHEIFEECETIIISSLSLAIQEYMYQYPVLDTKDGFYDTGYRLQHYEQHSGGYKKHCDSLPWNAEPVNRRVLAILMYLNTVETGGGTHFPDQLVTVSANCGDIAIFPATWTHPHVGQKPISGDKWIISSFLQCNTDNHIHGASDIMISPTLVDFESEVNA